ncbi:MAG: spore coat associated protein CotJA [Anaerovoracaceae bacterium]
MTNNESLSTNALYEEPYVGMPVSIQRMDSRHGRTVCAGVDSCPLAMTYTPWQCMKNTYEPAVALKRGTLFPELDLPWEVR